MSNLIHDLRYAIRVLAKSPAFTAIAVVTLALGIGVNSVMFSLVDAVLFRPLPVDRPEQVVRIGTTFGSGASSGVNYPLMKDFRQQSDAFAGIAAFSGGNTVHLGIGEDQPDRVLATVVSGNYFSVLGVKPGVGRLIGEQDDLTPGGHPVLMLSDAYWRRRFGASRFVIGTTVRMNTHLYTIVGVSPRGFHGTEFASVPDAWIPLQMIEQVSPNLAQFKPLERRGFAWLDVLGRMKEGISSAQGIAQLQTIHDRIVQELKLDEKDSKVHAVPLLASTINNERQDVQKISWVLMGVAGLVLLIACAVAAGLLMVRAEQRQREVAVRFAIGASRIRVVRQLLTESFLLAGVAAVLGVFLAVWGADIFAQISPETFPLPAKATSPILESRVLWFTGALVLLCTATFGLLPAWKASQTNLMEAMKQESAFGRNRGGWFSLRNSFVVTQVALSAVLLVGAGLLLRTLGNANRVNLGFDSRNGLVVSLDASKSGYTRARGQQFHKDLLERVRQLPGVRAAAMTRHVPVGDSGMVSSLELTNFTPADGREPMTSFASISPDYFKAIGIPMERGRDFVEQDGLGPQVVIINRAFADRFWPGRDPLQERVKNFGEKGAEVIAVVANAKLMSVREEPTPMLYVPTAAYYVPNTHLLVRTNDNAPGVLPAILATAAQLDRNVPLYRTRTLEEHLAASLGAERMFAALLSVFGSLALVLAAVGLYGAIAYTTQIRTREFGIRLALGAYPADLLRLVLWQGAWLASTGVVIGLVAAAGASRVLASLLFGVQPTDLLTFASIAAVLLTVALCASAIPARRAARVDPNTTLRYE